MLELSKEERKVASRGDAGRQQARARTRPGRALRRRTQALLLVFQAMDAAGKDSTIKHVMSGVNPQGCEVTSFKQPSAEELAHDFLWRCAKARPERGRIGIFNRSYYEEVLVVKVHPEWLDKQRLPARRRREKFWKQRYEAINDFEQHLRERHGDRQVLPQRLPGRAARTVPRPHRRSRQELEVLLGRPHRAGAVAGVHGRLRERDQRDRDAPCAVVRIPADRKWAMRTAVADIVTTTLLEWTSPTRPSTTPRWPGCRRQRPRSSPKGPELRHVLVLADSLSFHGPERPERPDDPRLYPNVCATALSTAAATRPASRGRPTRSPAWAGRRATPGGR